MCNIAYMWEIIKEEDSRSLSISGSYTDKITAENDARKEANLFISQCGYAVRIEFMECCAVCGSTGMVERPNKRNKLTKVVSKCPDCKGKLNAKNYNLPLA